MATGNASGMRLDTVNIPVPLSATAGAAVLVRDLRDKYLQIVGPFVGSLDLEGSLNGTAWVKLATGITASGIRAVPETVTHLRLVSAGVVSGTPSALVGGFNVRAD
jgi:hypothetical protein